MQWNHYQYNGTEQLTIIVNITLYFLQFHGQSFVLAIITLVRATLKSCFPAYSINVHINKKEQKFGNKNNTFYF